MSLWHVIYISVKLLKLRLFEMNAGVWPPWNRKRPLRFSTMQPKITFMYKQQYLTQLLHTKHVVIKVFQACTAGWHIVVSVNSTWEDSDVAWRRKTFVAHLWVSVCVRVCAVGGKGKWEGTGPSQMGGFQLQNFLLCPKANFKLFCIILLYKN